jgi:hypothetical protein
MNIDWEEFFPNYRANETLASRLEQLEWDGYLYGFEVPGEALRDAYPGIGLGLYENFIVNEIEDSSIHKFGVWTCWFCSSRESFFVHFKSDIDAIMARMILL